MRVSFALPALAVAAVLCASCGSADREPAADGPEVDANFIYRLLDGRSQAIAYAAPPRSIVKALPGADNGELVQRAYQAEALVTGSVTVVESAQLLVLDGSSDTTAPSTATIADTNVLAVTMTVDSVVCASAEVPDTVEFRFPVDYSASIDDVSDGFDEIGPIAVFLRESEQDGGPRFDQSMIELLSAVDEDGHLDWPLAENTFGKQWVEGGHSVEDLRSACLA